MPVISQVLVSFTFPRYVRYALNFTYSLSDGDTTQEHSYVHVFSQLTNDTALYYTQLSHALSAGDSISACLAPIQQCGADVPPVSATKQCYSYSFCEFRNVCLLLAFMYYITYLLL